MTCDFDLVDENPDILELLPTNCKQAYNDPELRLSMTYESTRFKEFMTELETREKWDEQAAEGRESLDLNFGLRETVYGSVDGNCTMTSENSKGFLDCLIRNRETMIDTIRQTK